MKPHTTLARRTLARVISVALTAMTLIATTGTADALAQHLRP